MKLAIAGLAAALVASAALAGDSPRLSELPVSTGQVGLLHVTSSGRVLHDSLPQPKQEPIRDPAQGQLEGGGGNCGVVSSHTSASFTGDTYTLQSGMGEGEIAAAQYVIPAAAFPIRLDLFEVIFGTQNTTVQTTTQYTIMVWEGPPSTGNMVFQFSSDGVILPHLVIPPGTNGVNLQFSIDPGDPDQIIINNDGSNSFSVGVRIDQHNDQTGNPCSTPPNPRRNAFPATDNTTINCGSGYAQLNQPSRNWLFGLDCGANGCPPNGGWSSFAGLSADQNFPPFCFTGCRPRGDWVMRATWSAVACTPGVGACCLPDGTCFVGAVADCDTQGGTFQGDGTDCAGANCPQPMGACCFGTSCANLSVADCATAGGTFLGAGTQCAPSNTCPLGACCLANGSCVILTAAQCTAQGGTFRGVGSDCGSANCPAPTGACCLSNGNCIRVTQTDCTAIGGTYQGNGLACGAGGACPTGACCMPDGSCALQTSAACAAAGGTFAGVGVSCSAANCPQPTGACCLSNGNCLILARNDCLGIPDATFAGGGTACTACVPPCPADFNGDGFVDPDDLSDFITCFFLDVQNPGTCPASDFNADGFRDPDDLSDFITTFFSSTC